MAKNLAKNSVLALCVFVVIMILAYTNVEFAEPVTEYVVFVVNTDFSVEPILEKVGLAARWDSLNLESLFEGWSEVTAGW